MSLKLTLQGEELLQKLQVGESQAIDFTDIAIGAGVWQESELDTQISALKDVRLKQAFATKYSEQKDGKTSIFITTTFRNEGVAQTFYVYEVGVYAMKDGAEVLYAYEIIPAGTPALAVVQDQSIPQYAPVSLDIGISDINGINMTFASDVSVVSADAFRGHTEDFNNPHRVNKAQVGLANADDTSDLDKPISAAAQAALNRKSDTGHHHTLSDETIEGVLPMTKGGTGSIYGAQPYTVMQEGRNLLQVLGVSSVKDAMDALRARCNGTGTPNFAGLELGDYLDLGDITIDDTLYQANSEYHNTRVTIAGFNYFLNTYVGNGAGQGTCTKNHIVFMFRQCLTTRRMNATDTNAGGYDASELGQWITASWGTAINAALGGDYIMPVHLLQSTATVTGKWNNEWTVSYPVWLPTEHMVNGAHIWSDAQDFAYTPQLPIFQKSGSYRVKRYNGAIYWWWLSSPCGVTHYRDAAGLNNTNYFCGVGGSGMAARGRAARVRGVSPCFVIA